MYGAQAGLWDTCICIFTQNSFIIVMLQYLRCSQRCLHCWLQIYAKLISNNWIIKCTFNYPIIWYNNKITHLYFKGKERRRPQFFPFIKLCQYSCVSAVVSTVVSVQLCQCSCVSTVVSVQLCQYSCISTVVSVQLCQCSCQYSCISTVVSVQLSVQLCQYSCISTVVSVQLSVQLYQYSCVSNR